MDSYSSSSSIDEIDKKIVGDDNNKDDSSENETESVASNEPLTDEDEMEDNKSDNENKILRSDEEVEEYDEEEEEEIDDVKDGDVKNIKEDHVVDNDDDDDEYEDIDDEEENEDSNEEEDVIKEEPTTTKRSRKKVIRLFSSDESYKKLISKTCNIYKNTTKDHSSLLFKKRYVMLTHSGPIGFSNIPMIDMESIPELPDVLPPTLKMLNVCDHEYKTVSKQTRAGDEMITIYKYCTKCGDMENEKQ